MMQRACLLFVVLASLVHGAFAHESRPASLELKETVPGRYDVLWRTPLLAGMRLPVRLVFPEAVRHVTEPREHVLADSVVERRVIDVGTGGLGGQRLQFVGLQATITDVLVRVSLLSGAHWTILVRPSQPWVEFTGAKSALEVARTYLVYGVEHIVFGVDHLLFVFGLLLLVQDRWMLLKTVTSFTLAHSLTLAVATLGYASVPMLPLNAMIALSILFLGPEIVRSWRGETSLTLRHPWLVAFVFGLLHGFGFASALADAGLPRRDLPLALGTFNVGVELGQVAFVVLMVRLERSFQQLEIRWPRWVAMVPGYVVGTLGAFWTIQRTAMLFGGIR
jgi:hydrogenase/urease accessory protein HupE